MTTIDLSPLYRSTVGFDRLAPMLDAAFGSDQVSNYPLYNIETLEENNYAITLAVAGFKKEDIDIQIENSVLTIHGKPAMDTKEDKYLYRGIPQGEFKLQFALADYVEVTEAELRDGLLFIRLLKNIPDEIKPRTIAINSKTLSHDKVA